VAALVEEKRVARTADLDVRDVARVDPLERLDDVRPADDELAGLEFHALDEARFPSVGLARQAALAGGGHPAVLNAANEEAVNAFLAGDIAFSGIVRTVERALAAFPGSRDSLQEILDSDRWAREYVKANSGRLRT
jgi:1-deoxy-D-xylulose-5-phosphate reductoisomerase